MRLSCGSTVAAALKTRPVCWSVAEKLFCCRPLVAVEHLKIIKHQTNFKAGVTGKGALSLSNA